MVRTRGRHFAARVFDALRLQTNGFRCRTRLFRFRLLTSFFRARRRFTFGRHRTFLRLAATRFRFARHRLGGSGALGFRTPRRFGRFHLRGQLAILFGLPLHVATAVFGSLAFGRQLCGLRRPRLLGALPFPGGRPFGLGTRRLAQSRLFVARRVCNPLRLARLRFAQLLLQRFGLRLAAKPRLLVTPRFFGKTRLSFGCRDLREALALVFAYLRSQRCLVARRNRYGRWRRTHGPFTHGRVRTHAGQALRARFFGPRERRKCEQRSDQPGNRLALKLRLGIRHVDPLMMK
ncbi:hypothetical protein WK68_20515 [Burkholderia ubonensis]|nr:hypothetical protein WK68_20515 [Burkholderia ubonensis]